MPLDFLLTVIVAGVSIGATFMCYDLFVMGGWIKSYMKNNPEATDHRAMEVWNFLESDQTNTVPYSWPFFICGNYALNVHNNAEAAGFRAGIVVVDMVDDKGRWAPGHVLNVFECTDWGRMYIDCTTKDLIATVEPGQPYIVKPLYSAPSAEYRPFNGSYIKGIRSEWW